MKYTKEELKNYILGEDTKTNIEILENDEMFMLEVMKITRDKNFYLLCSDHVKRNYEFVKEVILIFQNDKDFISKVANTYLENCQEEINILELLIILCNLYKDAKDLKIKYNILVESNFQSIRVASELAKIQDPENKNIGLGFIYVLDKYSSSRIIMDYYAQKMIDAIFEEEEIDLEKYLHQYHHNFNEIEKLGINNYLLSFISYYDKALSDYLCVHIDLLKDLRNRLEIIKENWEKFEKRLEQVKYEMILDYTHEYMEQFLFDTMFSEAEILYTIARELGIAEKVFYYDSIDEEAYQMFLKSISNDDKKFWRFQDFQRYNHLKEKIIAILSLNNTRQEKKKQIDLDEIKRS